MKCVCSEFVRRQIYLCVDVRIYHHGDKCVLPDKYTIETGEVLILRFYIKTDAYEGKTN